MGKIIHKIITIKSVAIILGPISIGISLLEIVGAVAFLLIGQSMNLSDEEWGSVLLAGIMGFIGGIFGLPLAIIYFNSTRSSWALKNFPKKQKEEICLLNSNLNISNLKISQQEKILNLCQNNFHCNFIFSLLE